MAARFFDSVTHKGTPGYLGSQYKLYERLPVTELWNRLSRVTEKQWSWAKVDVNHRWVAPDLRVAIVSGPPGNGKSSACYEWAVQTCKLDWVDCVTWVDCATQERGPGAWVLQQCTKSSNGYRVESVPIPQHSDDIAGKVVIFDGLRMETINSWVGVVASLCRKGIAVILCSSESVRIHIGNTQDIIQIRHRFPSWTLEEYGHACSADEFWKKARSRLPGSPPEEASSARKESALRRKFYDAGHCARFMFRLTRNTVVDQINEGAKALSGDTKSMQDALIKSGNSGAVNRLIAFVKKNGPTQSAVAVLPADVPAAQDADALQVHDDEIDISQQENIFVSAYAARAVLSTMPVSVDKIRAVAAVTKNNAIEGYALEIRFQEKLRRARDTSSDLSVITSSGASEKWSVASLQEASPASIEEDVLKETATAGAWFWIGGNRGGFDAVHICGASSIRFVGTTAGKSHSLLLDFVQKLLLNLALKGKKFTTVDFVILRPSDDTRQFYLEPARDRLSQGWMDFDGHPWAQGDQRDHARVLKLDW